MKTIAVLTDLSESSEHAAQYALHLAKKMKAKVSLYNINQVPVPMDMQLLYAWPDEDNSEIQTETHKCMAAYSDKLLRGLRLKSFTEASLPEITIEPGEGDIVDVMTTVVANENIALIVTAPLGNDDITTFMLSEKGRQIIDWAAVPVIIVPCMAAIRNPEKIVYTTNLSGNDITSINSITGFAEQFSSELMVTYLNDEPLPVPDVQNAEKSLLMDLHDKVDYGRIYYRNISCTNSKGWNWLNDNKKSDILAMVQQPQHKLKQFFKRGQTCAVTYHISIPVLIFPAIF